MSDEIDNADEIISSAGFDPSERMLLELLEPRFVDDIVCERRGSDVRTIIFADETLLNGAPPRIIGSLLRLEQIDCLPGVSGPFVARGKRTYFGDR
ncbi:MAG: hypothetical protein JWP75_1929 [Frondihabitans sp.]|nr:hypothetical protein [Frondihabitans sp.]